MRKAVPLLLVVLAWTACSRSPYPGYKRLDGDLHYKLLVIGDGDRLMTDSDHVKMAVRAAQGDAAPGTLYSTEVYAEAWSMLGSPLAPLLRKLHEGDSVSAWMKAADVPWSKLGAARTPVDTGMVRLELGLRAVRSAAQVREEEAAYNAWRTDREIEERLLLDRYLATHGIDKDASAVQGIHILPIKPGEGELLRTGDLVTVAYVAHGLDGTVFDDTYKAGTPLTFRLGDPGQVVRGLEIGLRRMAYGGKSTIIIPSQFAFGDDGSSGGIVPPFTTVIYELEVLREDAAEKR